MNRFCGVLVLVAVVGCDYVDRRVTDGERADRLYQAAMSEYAAGRLDKAVDGLEKVVRHNPGNASARFQLACLLQDHRKDPLGAICNYREYMALFPEGDKVKIAKARLATCEAQLARLLVKKHNLGGSVAQDEANARLMGDKAKLTEELEETRKELEKLKADFAASRRENERVRRMVMAGAEDGAHGDAAKESAGRASAGATTPKKIPVLPDEKALLEDDDTSGVDRVKFSEDVANLVAEEKSETSEASPFGKTVRRPPPPKKKPDVQLPPHEPKPDYYVVQEGDTLFRLAMRFYGRRSAWTQIRDANKESISSDNRIKAGQKLKMP